MSSDNSSTAIKAIIFSSLGAAFLVRGLFRPTRALVKTGEISRCSGPNNFDVCDPSIAVKTELKEKVYSTLSGQVIYVGSDYIHILSTNEPVIVMYKGFSETGGIDVKLNQFVSPGQKLGSSEGLITFSVTQMGPNGTKLIPPSAWLAARGCKPAVNNKGNKNLWCAQGRHIKVPTSARQACEFRKPESANFAMLPVTFEMN